MKKTIVVAALAITASGMAAFTFLKGNAWSVKNDGVKINFILPSEPHQLSFSGLNADINFDASMPMSSEIIARIDVKTLKTEASGLTEHLLSADFLDVAKYPEIKFISSRIMKTDSGYVAYGGLCMKDSVKAVKLPFTFTEKGDEGMFKGTLHIFSGDYGVMKKSKSGGDEVVISLEIPVTKK